MRVIMNGLSALKPKTGIGHYIDCLFRELRTLMPNELTFYPQGWQQSLMRKSYSLVAGARRAPSNGRAKFSPIKSLVRRSAPMLRDVGNFVLSRAFRQECRRQKFDLYHEPNYIPFETDLPTVATLHDLSVIVHPEWHPADRVRAWEKQFYEGLLRCDHFIAGSEFSRREVIERLGVPRHRVSVVYYGMREQLIPQSPDRIQETLRALELPSDFLLYIGTIEPRKNLLMLMQAYLSLPAKLREACPLVLAGGWGWNTAELATFYHDVAKPAGVRHLGYIDEDVLPVLYSAARALVYPSLYEGFGLPPLEMMACGGAVIASDIPPIRELIAGKAILIDPLDIDRWRDEMASIIENDDRVQQLRRGVESHAKSFTWGRCARETLNVYRLMRGEKMQRAA